VKSTRFLGQDKIIVEETPMPKPGAGEVLLKTSYCGICGSDKRLFHNGAKVTPGHELTGVVIENGAGANVPVGTRAAIYIHKYCGKCKFCLVGETNRCLNGGGLVGWQTAGGYAEYLIVPATSIIPLPDDISDGEGVLLLDTIGTAAYGIRRCVQATNSAARADDAVVIGCGPLGLGSLLVLIGLGWKNVYVYDPAESRLQTALSFGGKRFDPSLPENESRFSIVVEASGSQPGRATAINLVEAGGAVLFLGESDVPTTVQETPKMRRKDCNYMRTFYFPINQAPDNMELLRACRPQYQQMIADVVTLEGLEQAFVDFIAGKTLKPLVKPSA
jgi:threonine dehydrogenase-like Zn-dependent dehydrogenase